MKLKDLYDYFVQFEVKDNDAALDMFYSLKEKIGNNISRFTDTGILSETQIVSAGVIVYYAIHEDYTYAYDELVKFLHNGGCNNHTLTNAEYAILRTVLVSIRKKR